MRRSITFLLTIPVGLLVACGGSSTTKTTPVEITVAAPQFTPAPGTYSTTQSVTISDATAGATIYYTTDGTTPTSSSQQYSAPITVSGSQIIQAIATASAATTSAVANGNYSIVPPVVSSSSYDFGQDLLNTTLTRTVTTITNNGPTAAPVALALTGDPSFTLVTSQSCGATIPANSSCPVVIAYDPLASGAQTASVSATFTGGKTTPSLVTLTGTSAAISAGTVSTSNNPLVATYSITSSFPASVTINFGPTTSYGYNTSATQTPSAGGPVNILVAGMRANSVYHMQAVVTLANGTVFTDSDHTFTTGAIVGNIVPPITTATTPGLTPQPGIELMDTVAGGYQATTLATDLAGNVIWYYTPPDAQNPTIEYPIKQMPNGNFIMEISPTSQSIIASPPPANTLIELREVDLAGNIVRQLSMAQLNQRLIAAGFTGLTLELFSHDVTLLPNGHMLVIANLYKTFSSVTGYTGPVQVLGDAIVDLDQDMNPVWVWNEFDHFDVNRHPMGFPDWTHSNAVVYSADDGNFLVSIRHQNWVVKVNYQDGKGDGSVLWKLGYQGDFTLVGGTSPQDWFFSQHNPVFFSANTTGSFSLSLMDNGDDRTFPNGTTCLAEMGALCYTTIPIMQIDEKAMTATFTSHQVLPSNLYSAFAGDVALLPNQNIEYNLAGVGKDAYIFEVTPTATPETVWQFHMTGENTYRAFRIPSLYPGVTWPGSLPTQ